MTPISIDSFTRQATRLLLQHLEERSLAQAQRTSELFGAGVLARA